MMYIGKYDILVPMVNQCFAEYGDECCCDFAKFVYNSMRNDGQSVEIPSTPEDKVSLTCYLLLTYLIKWVHRSSSLDTSYYISLGYSISFFNKLLKII